MLLFYILAAMQHRGTANSGVHAEEEQAGPPTLLLQVQPQSRHSHAPDSSWLHLWTQWLCTVYCRLELWQKR